MVTTRTRIGGDFIESADTCTTRTRISRDFVEPSDSYCNPVRTCRSSWWSPSSWWNEPTYVTRTRFVEPIVITDTPIVTTTAETSGIAECLFGTALVVGLIALIALAPVPSVRVSGKWCNVEKVCSNIWGTGLKNCHFEKVCKHFF